jgi:K+-transporting ATPase ATPase C chain
MFCYLRPAVVATVLFTALLGLAYPLAITGAAQVAIPDQARGELVRDHSGHVIGSRLIAQPFTRPEYLHPRPSAAGKGWDTSASGGSNFGPLNPDLIKRVKTDSAAYRADNGVTKVPGDAATASGSGLDPEISPANARLQAARIAHARGVSPEAIQAVIDRITEGPSLNVFGQPRVNVLDVNLALDARYPTRAQPSKVKP